MAGRNPSNRQTEMLTEGDALFVLVLALALDAAVGDPDWLWRRVPHPVVFIGRAIAVADRSLNTGMDVRRRCWLGAASVTAIITASAALGYGLERALRSAPGGPVLVAIAASILLAGRSLYDHVAHVRDALPRGLPAARVAVSAIVGRDPESLDEAGVARAAIESAAENFSDGVVAPAFWFAVAGLPGLLAYKAVNTADSMIGHLAERHRAFGWAAARLDDIANLAPARLSGALIALAAPLAGGSVRNAYRIMVRDAGLHRSPNAGWPESAMAAALGIRLGGPRVYAAEPVDEPFLNAAGRAEAGMADIGRALRVMVGAGVLHAAAYLLLATLLV